MADDVQDANPKGESLNVQAKEDAETRAARRELKQSSISDQPGNDRPDSPADDAQEDDLREKVSSPKKKRAHDQVEGEVVAPDADATSIASTDSGKDRTTRLEPEKKRHRDEDSKDGEAESTDKTIDAPVDAGKPPAKNDGPTSASAFAASGFSKLATAASPFGSFGSGTSSPFGSGQPKLTSFASPAPAPASQVPAAAPKLTFGSAAGNSPFAGLSGSSNGFAGSLGGSAFGSALSGTKPLSGFGAPGVTPFQSGKPAKPFGAPESDADDSGDDEGDDDEDAQPDEDRASTPEKESDEKKKLKLQKVEVNDGEAGESTIVSVRAKMFVLDKDAGWKERGAGMLRINVPTECVEFDDAGAVIPRSFDASSLEESDDKPPKVVRLLMRQDQTHRVILNTALLPGTKFQQKASLKSVGVIFTAFQGEDPKPTVVTMRMSAASAKTLMNEISSIQRELQGN